jgi:hypothetical protein
MIASDPRFEINVTEKRPRPLVFASHGPILAITRKTESHYTTHGERLFQQPARSAGEVPYEDTGINVSSVLAWEDSSEGPLYLVTPQPSDSDFYVHCAVKAVSENVTYTRRQASFLSWTIFDHFPDRQKQLPPDGFEPLSQYLLKVNLVGSENVSFDFGYEDRQLPDSGKARIVPKGAAVTVQWTNIYSEQMRDIILIVIGSLIAVGVTMLIEAIRPFVDRIGSARVRRPARQNSESSNDFESG